MLTFFRRIRKGLLDGGRTSKYLLYAIGEILLVMIGILLAWQVNNWNEWRKDRVKENEVLLDIKIINHFERDLPLSVSLCKQETPNLSNYAEYFTRNFKRKRQIGLQGVEMVPFNYSEIVRDKYRINIFNDLQQLRLKRKAFA